MIDRVVYLYTLFGGICLQLYSHCSICACYFAIINYLFCITRLLCLYMLFSSPLTKYTRGETHETRCGQGFFAGLKSCTHTCTHGTLTRKPARVRKPMPITSRIIGPSPSPAHHHHQPITTTNPPPTHHCPPLPPPMQTREGRVTGHQPGPPPPPSPMINQVCCLIWLLFYLLTT